ncbi:MAG TPA: class I SAM-dependent methyltransferase [Myxococcales bacterium]|jgi:2-polyprenyl-3-methyl-5-hydroxy-6-metoxy-1,4-benzoquinol methylase|nr:class I SAM-dependent methyltransferase [Myxococcales bacterium]
MARREGRERFDAAYFRRFYGARGRVHGPREIAQLARGLTGLAAWLGQPIASVLDVGAGIGLWRDWFARWRPSVHYRSTDVSAYACRAYGHERRDIATFRARERFDLIICHGVLQYLDDKGAARAIENIAAMSRGLVYLEVITRGDLRAVCDLDATDTAIHRRTAGWYRARLRPHFQQVGAGLFASRRSGLRFYELEAAGR